MATENQDDNTKL